MNDPFIQKLLRASLLTEGDVAVLFSEAAQRMYELTVALEHATELSNPYREVESSFEQRSKWVLPKKLH